jgi:hypothetical protein
MKRTTKSKINVPSILGIVGGAVVAGIAKKTLETKAPNLPAVVRGLLPVGLGIFLSMQKNEIVKGAGLGMIAKGGLDLASAFIPGIGAAEVDDLFLSASDDMDDFMSLPADQSILSLPADQSILSGMDDDDNSFMNGEDFDEN